MAKPAAEVLKRIEDLLARAADKGATEEERRTSASIAARLMREHDIKIGPPPKEEPAPSLPPSPGVVVAIERARAVGEAVKAGADGLNKALGFDVFSFAQGLLRERVQAELEGALRQRAPVRARGRTSKRRRA